jgi:hypothetical protein
MSTSNGTSNNGSGGVGQTGDPPHERRDSVESVAGLSPRQNKKPRTDTKHVGTFSRDISLQARLLENEVWLNH